MPVIFLFLLFIIITIHVSISKSKNIKYNLRNIDSIPYKLLLKKENIKSSACMATFNKNNIKGYNFTKADLFFFENAFLIAGHFSFFKQKNIHYHHYYYKKRRYLSPVFSFCYNY